MSKSVLIANKSYVVRFLRKLQEHSKAGNHIIGFPDCNLVYSWVRPRKGERRVSLQDIQRMGYIEIIPYHGIRVIRGA